MRDLELAGLTVRLAGGTDREGGGDGPLVVLLHGFGAPGDDLVPLWRVLGAPPGTRWAFPAAPLVLGDELGAPRESAAFRDSRAWWIIDIERRLRAAERGRLEAMTLEVPFGMAEARAQVTAVLEELEVRLKPTSIVLGGFSQGAMLACDVALRTDRALAGIALLSGTLLAAKEWAPLAVGRRGLAVFQSHGAVDPLLPFAYAERLRDLLSTGGLDVTWVPFRGGHEIPDTVLSALGRWIRAVLT
jgi:phospholipase/carboxylesterase